MLLGINNVGSYKLFLAAHLLLKFEGKTAQRVA
jgi:hypothetical protein